MAREAGGLTYGFPPGRLVTGAGVGFGVGECFGQERCVAAARQPLVGQDGGGGGQDWGGEVGTAGGLRDEEAGLVDDEFEALGTGQRIPTDPGVAVFEMEGRRTPQEQAHPLAVLLGNLVKSVAGGEAGTQKVFGFQERVKALAVGEFGEHAHGQRTVGVRRWGGGASRFHPSLPCAGPGQILSPKRIA